MKSKAEKSQFSKLISDNGIWVVLVVLIIAITIVNRNFLTPNNAVALLTGESVKGVMTFGVTLAILSKGIDLSTGSVAALSAICSAALCQASASAVGRPAHHARDRRYPGRCRNRPDRRFCKRLMVAYLRLHPSSLLWAHS